MTLQASGRGQPGHHLPVPQPGGRTASRRRITAIDNGIRGVRRGAGWGTTRSPCPQYWQTERRGRDRADNRPEYKLKHHGCAVLFQQAGVSRIEYYHNSSWLEYGGSTGQGRAQRALCPRYRRLSRDRTTNITRVESKVTFAGYRRTALCWSPTASPPQASYENQTKKAVTNQVYPGRHDRVFPRAAAGLFH